MDVKFGDKKQIDSLNISGRPGSFATDTTPFSLETCRERFAKTFDENLKGFYFKVETGKCMNVACFIRKTELILEQKEFSQFSETNRDTFLWFEPTNFWKICPVRRSLVTIFLRCGMAYQPDINNYEEALFTQEFVIPTRRAVERFLFGFTKYVGPSILSDSSIQVRGWKTVFEGLSFREIKEILVSPEESRIVPKFDFETAMWI